MECPLKVIFMVKLAIIQHLFSKLTPVVIEEIDRLVIY